MVGPPRGQHHRWRGGVRRVLVILLALVVLGTGAWLVGFSAVLDVRMVRVERPPGSTGKALLTERQVLKTAQVPTGQPLARVDLQAIADRVATMPEVAEVTVSRILPHTVTVQVTERAPVYAVKTAGGDHQLVDADGIAYHRVDAVPRGMVSVTADRADRTLLTGLAGVVVALPPEVRRELTRIEVPTRDQVTLELGDGVRVIWGSPDDSVLKAQVAMVLLGVKGVRTVDVSAPSHPTTR